MTVQADVDLGAQLVAHMGSVAGALSERQQMLAEMCEDISNPEPRAIAFLGSDAPGGIGGAMAPKQWGPALGWSWYVSLITVGPLGSGDTLAIYRGRSPYDNEDQRLKYQFVGTNGTWQTWAPGRTGLGLRGGKDGLVFDPGSGSLTSGTRYFVNIDVIQVADRSLAKFLM